MINIRGEKRVRGDLIQIFKILKRVDKLDYSKKKYADFKKNKGALLNR